MNHKQRAHQFMHQFLNPSSIVIDMTCGNGHDTLFLAQHAYKVIAIDIQEQAIQSTQERCLGYANIEYICASHDSVDFKKNAPYTGAIYNLGYLPHSDKQQITTKETTVQSLKQLIPYLQSFLVIACYLKHDGGYEEYLAVKAYLDGVDAKVEILQYETPLSPVTFLVSF